MSEPHIVPTFINDDYWFKVVDFLQQNWAIIKTTEQGRCCIYFFGDTAGIFDTLDFSTQSNAEAGLVRNGFKRYADDSEAQQFIAIPKGPFEMRKHPNGSIYSSGRFWR